jgi:hypothetical protein
MKSKLFLSILFIVVIVVEISSVTGKVEKLVNDVQHILNTGNPYCVFYRDSVNAYLREIYPTYKCQLRCHNADDTYAEQFQNWYIPNNFPVDKINCGKVVDDCSYKFDEDWMYGRNFLTKMNEAKVFLDFITRKLTFCSD